MKWLLLQKQTKKDFEKRHMKSIKIFLKNKNQKAKKGTWSVSRYFSEKEKEKKHRYYCERYRNLSEDQN